MPIIQENPTYFSDGRDDVMDPSSPGQEVFYTKYGFQLNGTPRRGSIGGRRRDILLSTEDAEDVNELEVFLGESCDNNNINSRVNRNRNASFSHSTRSQSQSSSSGSNTKRNGTGIGQKLGKFFFKSKSKHSLGSESHMSESSGQLSPITPSSPRRFTPEEEGEDTPDSALSICTSSLDSSSSNQISPSDISNLLTKPLKRGFQDSDSRNNNGNVTLMNDQRPYYRFDDCERYAANMYYNMMGMDEPSSYTVEVVEQKPNHRLRNNSLDLNSNSGARLNRLNEIEDCVQPYYNNTTFSTFPNPRRHSSSSEKSSLVMKDKNHQIIEQDRDGYLRPNEPCKRRETGTRTVDGDIFHKKNGHYMNEVEAHYIPSNEGIVQVHVDVHRPKDISSLNSTTANVTEFDSQRRNNRFFSRRESETSGGTVDDSQSTLVGGSSGSYIPPLYQNDGVFNFSESTTSLASSRRKASRAASGKTDCDPYCTLCVLTNAMPISAKRTEMNVAIVSCHECFYSKNAETHLRSFFDKLRTADNQHKIDVKLQSYDLKDLEHTKIAADVHQSKVQIVIISRTFLQRLKFEAATRVRLSPVNRVFRSKRVIAVLFGVSSQEIRDEYEAVLARFNEWFFVDLPSTSKLDASFCNKFSEQVVKIYNLELCYGSNFSVFPKKVTRDQPKIVVSFKKPLEPARDEIRVEFTNTGNRKVETASVIKLDNPYTLTVRVPEMISPESAALLEVNVYVNNQKLGATGIKSDFHSKQQYDDDVVEKLTQMIPGFLKLFDDHVKQTLTRNFQECTDFRMDSAIEIMNDVLICKGDEFPTVMHYAAYHGLEHTVFTLLDEADGLEQCKISNEKDMTPLDIAGVRCHDHIVHIIKDYQEITNQYKALKYIQDICGRASVVGFDDKISPMKRTEDVVFSYDNLPETSIITTTDSETAGSSPPLSSTSAGSYIVLPPQSMEVATTVVKPVKPTPNARSPRRKKKGDYVNVEGQDQGDLSPSPQPRGIAVTDAGVGEDVVVRRPRPREISKVGNRVRPRSLSPKDMYDIPRRECEDYKIPPLEAKPVIPPHHLLTKASIETSSPVLVKKISGNIPTEGGYIIMVDDKYMNISPETEIASGLQSPQRKISSKESSSTEASKISSVLIRAESSIGSQQQAPQQTDPVQAPRSPVRRATVGSSSVRKISNNSTLSPTPETELQVVLDPIDEELIQLMKDFPGGGYSIQQIELLFENWKQRSDVLQSIEEKKSYMKKLREDYKKIQGKRSLFDNIKSLVTGRKRSNIIPPRIENLERGGSIGTLVTSNNNVQSSRDSIGSHESGLSGSGQEQDSGVSETDSSEKDKDSNPHYNTSPSSHIRRVPYDQQQSSPVNPQRKELVGSYIAPDVKPKSSIPSEEQQLYGMNNSGSYEIPPPPRPVLQNSESQPQAPDVPKKPKKFQTLELFNAAGGAPVPPQKPSHMTMTRNSDDDNPPPPPPRSHIKPNPFNYVDYSTRDPTKPGSGIMPPKAYDNLMDK